MSWSYDPQLDTDLDLVRFYVGDTNTNNQRVSNEEITAILALEPIPILAAAMICDSLAGSQSSASSRSIGGTSVSGDSESAHFEKQAVRLRNQYRQKPVSIFMGGQTESDKDTRRSDTDLVQPFFERRGMDNPEVIDETLRADGIQ